MPLALASISSRSALKRMQVSASHSTSPHDFCRRSLEMERLLARLRHHFGPENCSLAPPRMHQHHPVVAVLVLEDAEHHRGRGVVDCSFSVKAESTDTTM
jgi:hypothetical protein